MKTKTLFFTLLLLPLLSLGQQRWEVVLGDLTKDDVSKGITSCDDNGNIIFNYNYNIFYILQKVSLNGELLWTKSLKPQPVTSISSSSVIENHKAFKLISGAIGYFGWEMLLNPCGEKLWCRLYNNSGIFWSVGFTDALMLDSIILVSAFTQDNDYNWGVYLLGFDYDGNLLWDKPIATHQQDPLLAEPIPAYLKMVDGDIFIVGDCYYAYPGNPNVFHLRPMFIKLDSLYNKEWFLPYGMADHVGGSAFGLIKLDSNEYRGYGVHHLGNNNYNSIFLNFDKNGNETRHKDITNESIAPNIGFNTLLSLNVINDSTYYITSQIDTTSYHSDIMGEFVVDSSGNNVSGYKIHHEIVQVNIHPTLKTYDSCFVSVATVQNATRDILLYKLNADLSQAPIDTNTYVYDSLCPHAIVSDTIYLNDCDIVTALPEFPTPAAWQQAKQTVEVTAYPNPAHGGTINFKLKYTKYHNNMQLAVYNTGGKRMVTQHITTGQEQASFGVSAFPPGMYVAVVRDSKQVLGKAVFSVVE